LLFLSYVIWTFHLEYKFLLEILEFKALKFIIIDIITLPLSLLSQILRTSLRA